MLHGIYVTHNNEVFIMSHKTHVDDKGRVCTQCGKYKEWGFYSRNSRGGHRANCKQCKNERTKARAKERGRQQYDCKHCGTRLIGRRVCDNCKKAPTNHGTNYLVVHDPCPPNAFKGRILKNMPLEETLKLGHFDAGMRLLKRNHGKSTGELYEVVGEHFSKQRLERLK